jgi:hypothetical protein
MVWKGLALPGRTRKVQVIPEQDKEGAKLYGSEREAGTIGCERLGSGGDYLLRSPIIGTFRP